ncbi:MAG TPA: Ig-like domain repeat protein [Acidobacteriaceae bacterium]|nr:Ig-like domain repeat protein [Acidobacteriaceae bacterium]
MCGRWLGLAALLCAVVAGATTGQAQSLSAFGTIATGSSSAQTVTVAAQAAGTVSAVEVLTLGQPNLDYTASGANSCAGANLMVNSTCQLTVSFSPLYPGVRNGAVVLLDSSNNVLGTQYLTGTGQGALGVMVPGTMQTAVGSGDWTSVNDGDSALEGDLDLPAGVVVDGIGDIFIADSAHNRIREVYASGPNKGLIETICNTTGQPDYTGDGGAAINATISNPQSIAIDGAGNLYIADTGNNAIRRIDAFTGIITSVVNHPLSGAETTTAGFSGDGGLATAALLDTPYGVTVNAAGDLFIADTKNQRIREVTYPAGTITTIAGTGATSAPGMGEYSGDGGPAIAADLNLPFAVAFDGAGNMYIPDSGNNRIRVVFMTGALAGTINTFAGDGNATFGGDGDAATSASFYAPSGLVFDVAGNLYVADTQNNRVRKISASTGLISTIAGNGSGKYVGDGGSATAAGLYGPQGLFLDGLGNLYIADFFDHRIREIQSRLAILTFTPAIRVDQTTPPQTQPIENDGNAGLTFATIAPDANAAVDASTTTCSTSTVLGINAECNVGAEFAPTQVGDPVTGNINLTGNPANSPLDIEVVDQSLTLTSTTTTLSATPNPALFGTQVVLSATVSTGTGTLSGHVTFMDGSTALGSANLSSSGTTGTATFTTSSLTVGAHQITAVYAGDGVHGTSTSAAVTETIQEATTVVVTSSENPSISGDSVTFTATVSATSGGAAPTGTVVFKDGATVLGSAPLSGSNAAFTTAALSPGTHSITAAYSGDTVNAASTSAVLSQVVKATTSVTVVGVANPANYGSQVTFTATVQGNGGTPTGTVTFTADGSPIGSQALAGGSASVSIATLTVGTHSIVASYSGDASDAASSSAAYTETVQKATLAATLASTPNPSASGQTVTFTATVKGGTTTPTGTVTLEDGGTAIGNSPLPGNGIVTFSVATLAVGTHTMTAVYGGDGNYAASTSGAVSQKVLPNTAAVVSSSANPSIAGTSVTLTVTVTGSTPTGSVTLKDGAATLATLSLGAGGAASYTTSSLTVGTHSITAVYGGDANNAGTTSPALMQVVNLATTTTTVSASANPTTAGKSVNLVATVTGNGGTPTGTVKFYSQGNLVGSAALNGSGVATYSISSLAVGSDSITAEYSGDAKDQASTSAPYGLSVVLASSSVKLVSSLNPAPAVKTIVFTATVTGTGGTPTGQVIFQDGATTLGAVTLSGGVASYSTSSLAIGQHTITANYQGDANDGAASASLTETIQQATPSISVSSSLNPSTVGAGVSFTAALSGAAGTPTGTVTFLDGGTSLGTANLAPNGRAVFSTTALALGQHSITVSYSGDTNNAAAVSTTLTQTVQETTATTVVSNKNPSVGGTPVTFTASVAGTSHGTVTGTVTFKNGGSILGTGTVSGGVATYTTSALPVGTDSITAVYGGDTLNAASTSAGLTQTVEAAGTSTTLTSSDNPSLLGANVTFTATVTGNGATPTGNVTFKDGANTLATVSLGATGVASYSTATLAVGVHPITAVYNGDADNQKDTSAVLNQAVQAHTTIVIGSSANPALAAASVTFTASVTNGMGTPPTGTVTFKDGTYSLAQITLPANGTVTFTTATLAVGTHSITAVYSGDTDDEAATSTVLAQVIQAIPTKTTLGASPTSLNTDQQVSLVASVFSAGTVPITGTVTFENGATAIGTATLGASGTATLSTALAAGNYNIVAVYSGDALNAGSTSVPVSVTVVAANDFNMSLNPTTVTMATKKYSTVTLTLTSTDGFTDEVGLGCASLPASVSCSFSKDTVNLAANATTTVQLTIDTSSPLTAGGQAKMEKMEKPGGLSPAVAAAWIFPGSILFGLVFWRFRRRHNAVFCLLLLVLLSGAAFTMTGCGGLTISGAQPGTYTFQVTATGVKTGMNHAINMTLTVNQ